MPQTTNAQGYPVWDGTAIPAASRTNVTARLDSLTERVEDLEGGGASVVAVGSITGLGTGVSTALAVNVGSTGAFVVQNGALGTPSTGTLSGCGGLPLASGITGFGTGVATALAVNTGSTGAFVVQNGALGTPSTGTLSSCGGLPLATGITGFGTGVATALAVNTGSTGAFVVQNGALGTPSTGTLSGCSGLPLASGITGFGTGVATALAVNTGSTGAFVVQNGALGTPSTGSLASCTGLPISTGVSGLGTGIAAALAVNTGSAGAPVLFNGALGTPLSGVGTNLTALTAANITGSTVLGRSLLSAKNVLYYSWVSAGLALQSGTGTGLKTAQHAGGLLELMNTGAFTGLARATGGNNYGATHPFTAFLPGSRGAVTGHTSSTVDFDRPWAVAWSGTNYMGANTAQHDLLIVASYGATSATLGAKGFRVKWLASGTGATDCVMSIIPHNGTAEQAATSTGTMSGADYTLHSYLLVWTPGVGVYLYQDETLKASTTANLPSGTGTANYTQPCAFLNFVNTDCIFTVQNLRCIWL